MIGTCKETAKNEKRVAITPEGVKKLTDSGVEVLVETGAGVESSYSDLDFTNAGAKIAQTREEVLKTCDILLAVQAPAVVISK